MPTEPPLLGPLPTEAEAVDIIGKELDRLVADLQDSYAESTAKYHGELEARLAEANGKLASLVAALEALESDVVKLKGPDDRDETVTAPVTSGSRGAGRSGKPAALPSAQGVSHAAREEISRTAHERAYPALPRTLTLRTLEAYLDRLVPKVDWKNFRRPTSRGGGFWVFVEQAEQLQPMIDKLVDRGISCRYYNAGARTRDYRAAWELDTKKELA